MPCLATKKNIATNYTDIAPPHTHKERKNRWKGTEKALESDSDMAMVLKK